MASVMDGGGVKWTLDVDSQNAQKQTQEFGNKFEKTMKTATKLLAAFSLAAGAVKLGQLMKSMATLGDSIDKTSQKMQMSSKAYQEWDYILGQNGGNIDAMQRGVTTLNNLFDDIKGGSKEAAEKLIKFQEATGVVIDLNAPMEETFGKIIEGLQGIEDPAKRNAVAYDLFGQSAKELTPLLNQSRESTEALREEAHKYNIVVSDEAIAASAHFIDASTTLSKSVRGNLLESFKDITNGVANLLTGITKAINGIDGADEEISAAISGIVESAISFIGRLIPRLAQIGFVITKGIAMGIVDSLANITDSLNETLTNACDWISDNIVPKMVEVGKFLLDGLTKGIKDFADDPIGAIGGVGKKLIDKFKKETDTHSPSKAFLELGKFITEGLTIGIEDGKGNAISAIEAIAKGMKDVVLESDLDWSVYGSSFEDAMKNSEEFAASVKARLRNASDDVASFADIWKAKFESIKSVSEGIMQDMMETLEEGIANGELSWNEFAKSGLNAIAAVIEGLGQCLIIKAVEALPNFYLSALYTAGAALAYAGAGLVKNMSNRFEYGGIIGGTGITGDRTQVWANAGELILSRAQQASIAAQLEAGTSGGSVSINFNGQVFGDKRSISTYVYNGIRSAQNEGALRSW